MYQIFRYKNVEMELKTTQMKHGIPQFNAEAQGILETEFKGLKYQYGDKTVPQILIMLYKGLEKKGIKANYIKAGDFKYTGIAMTDVGTEQTTLE